jgi:hypothetical protein
MTKVIAHPDSPSLAKAVATAAHLLRVLEEEGLSQTALQKPIDNLDFRRELVVWWETNANPASAGSTGGCTLAEAAQIMGSNFHGPQHTNKYFGVRMGQKVFKSVPFDAETLRAVADTHVLVAAPAVSVMDIRGKATDVFYSNRDPWYGLREQKFAQAKIEAGWYLVRKDEVPHSTSKRWSDQQTMVKSPDFVPEANLAAYAYAVHFLATGERMFSRVWTRTNSVAAEGGRVYLDGDADGLGVDDWNDGAGCDVGVASARKS